MDPNSRQSIVVHLHRGHRRGPEGVLPKAGRGYRRPVPRTTPTARAETNPATPDSTKPPPPYDSKNTQTDALIKENQLLKAENAKLKARLAEITRFVTSESVV